MKAKKLIGFLTSMTVASSFLTMLPMTASASFTSYTADFSSWGSEWTRVQVANSENARVSDGKLILENNSTSAVGVKLDLSDLAAGEYELSFDLNITDSYEVSGTKGQIATYFNDDNYKTVITPATNAFNIRNKPVYALQGSNSSTYSGTQKYRWNTADGTLKAYFNGAWRDVLSCPAGQTCFQLWEYGGMTAEITNFSIQPYVEPFTSYTADFSSFGSEWSRVNSATAENAYVSGGKLILKNTANSGLHPGVKLDLSGYDIPDGIYELSFDINVTESSNSGGNGQIATYFNGSAYMTDIVPLGNSFTARDATDNASQLNNLGGASSTYTGTQRFVWNTATGALKVYHVFNNQTYSRTLKTVAAGATSFEFWEYNGITAEITNFSIQPYVEPTPTPTAAPTVAPSFTSYTADFSALGSEWTHTGSVSGNKLTLVNGQEATIDFTKLGVPQSGKYTLSFDYAITNAVEGSTHPQLATYFNSTFWTSDVYPIDAAGHGSLLIYHNPNGTWIGETPISTSQTNNYAYSGRQTFDWDAATGTLTASSNEGNTRTLTKSDWQGVSYFKFLTLGTISVEITSFSLQPYVEPTATPTAVPTEAPTAAPTNAPFTPYVTDFSASLDSKWTTEGDVSVSGGKLIINGTSSQKASATLDLTALNAPAGNTYIVSFDYTITDVVDNPEFATYINGKWTTDVITNGTQSAPNMPSSVSFFPWDHAGAITTEADHSYSGVQTFIWNAATGEVTASIGEGASYTKTLSEYVGADSIKLCAFTHNNQTSYGSMKLTVNSFSIKAYDPNAVPTQVTASKAVAVANGDGTYKAGLVFDSINPSEFNTIVFKSGLEYRGGSVVEVLGGMYDGPVQLAIILDNAPSENVSVMLTTAELE